MTQNFYFVGGKLTQEIFCNNFPVDFAIVIVPWFLVSSNTEQEQEWPLLGDWLSTNAQGGRQKIQNMWIFIISLFFLNARFPSGLSCFSSLQSQGLGFLQLEKCTELGFMQLDFRSRLNLVAGIRSKLGRKTRFHNQPNWAGLKYFMFAMKISEQEILRLFCSNISAIPFRREWEKGEMRWKMQKLGKKERFAGSELCPQLAAA